MASSLNGLNVGHVGDPLPQNLMESLNYWRPTSSKSHEISCKILCDTHECLLTHPDSLPSSSVSPYRDQRPLNGFCFAPSTSSYPLHGNVSDVACSQPRQRGLDIEGRIPSSPSDIFHFVDSRKATLLQYVHIRTQPSGPSSFELSFGSGQ
ncbi:hypothetical protein DITRI_Ditri10aG0040800 [Diplodiscus trichospermus]